MKKTKSNMSQQICQWGHLSVLHFAPNLYCHNRLLRHPDRRWNFE